MVNMNCLNIDLFVHLINYLHPIEWAHLVFVSKQLFHYTKMAAEFILNQPQFDWLRSKNIDGSLPVQQSSSIEILSRIYNPKIIIIGGN